MRKKYILKNADDDRNFWEENWFVTNLEDAVRFCGESPVTPVLDKYFPKKGKILEGGCGPGYFVIYYSRMGYDMEVVDFAKGAINRTLSVYPETPIKEGNVLELDYPDNYFKAYYSGGVVEHFEDGPYAALKEAYRVLDKDGTLIISVPYFNLSRRINTYKNPALLINGSSDVYPDFDGFKSVYKLTPRHNRDGLNREGFSFHQYEYTKNEFARILDESGFDIILNRPLSIIWGLRDFSFIRKAMAEYSNQSISKIADSASAKPAVRSRDSFLKNLILKEDRNLPFAGPLLKVLGAGFANLILFVCKVRK